MTQHRFIEALYQRPHDGVPVWFMRQAGRYLPGYMSVRSKTDFLTLCRTPDLAAEVTLEPVDKFGVDAAIIFSDILVPLEGMGLTVEFTDRGPCMKDPLNGEADINRLVIPDPIAETGYVMDVIRAVKERAAGRVPVIGFAGAPFTLACYALEGSPSKTFARAMSLAYGDPALFRRLLDKLAETIIAYLKAQVEAGAEAIQLFDSWGGMLAHDTFGEYSLEYCKRIMQALDGCGVPRILFIKGAGLRLDEIADIGVEAISFDDSLHPAEAARIVGDRAALQGNLSPHALLGKPDTLCERVRGILDVLGSRPGYVFNLGHGILPPTPVENVRAVVDEVHAYKT